MLRGKDYQPFFHLAAANLQIIIELCKENLLIMIFFITFAAILEFLFVSCEQATPYLE